MREVGACLLHELLPHFFLHLTSRISSLLHLKAFPLFHHRVLESHKFRTKVIDRGGNKVTDIDVPVEVTVIGNGELVGCGNASIDGMKSFNHAQFKTWRAYGQIIVRPFAKPGDIIVKVKSDFGVSEVKLKVN